MDARTARRRRPSVRHVAATLLALVAAGALHAQDQRARIPTLKPPPPVEARFLRPVDGPVTLTVTDVAFRTRIGQQVRVARLEVVADPAALGGDAVHVRLIRIVRPSFISPVDTINTPFDPFVEIPGPRVTVDRLVIEDGTFGAHAHPSQFAGRWLWRTDDVDVDVRDIRVGGGAPEGLRLVDASLHGELKGDPLRVTSAAATVGRTPATLDLDVGADLGASDIAIAGVVRRSGAFRFDIRTTPLAFAEVRAFAGELPPEGTAEIDATVSGGAAPFELVLRRAVARVRSSDVSASGTIRTGAGGTVRDFVVDVARLASDDLDALYGVALPGGGVWRGRVRADGPLATGVALSGALERANDARAPGRAGDNGPGALPRFAFEGTLRTDPEPAVALDVDADRLPVREGVASARLNVSGPIDSLTVAGVVRADDVTPAVALVADIDALVIDPAGAAPRHAAATAAVRATIAARDGEPARDVSARVEGTAVLAGGGRVDARIVSDPLPFDLLPLPSAIDSVRGTMRADFAVTGTLDAPVLAGTLDVRDGAFRVPVARLHVHDLAGPVVVRDGVADLDGLAATANGGSLDVGGTIRLLGGERTADVTLAARDIALLANDSIAVLASGDVRATGLLAKPLVTADARLALPRPEGVLPLAVARGSVDMARDGALDFVLRADSLPLAALPVAAGVRDLRGAVRADVRIGGTLDAPTSEGRIDLRDAGVYVVRTGTDLDDLRGTAVVRDGLIVLDDVRGTVGGGALAVAGEARVAGGPRTLSLRATIDRGRVVDMDSAQVVASADVRAEGALASPRVDGTVTIHDGFVHEDNFTRPAPVDPDSPPYEDLVARVPWLEDSRLRGGGAKPRAEEEPARRPPEVRARETAASIERTIAEADAPAIVARIDVDIERRFRLVDEDSEIRGTGRITILVDSAGPRAEGIYRLTDGFYAQYGSVFEIRGGAFFFPGDDLAPRVSMRSEHRFEAPLGSWLAPGPRVLDRFPPLEFFALGSRESAGEEVRRLSLLPESRTELGALLLYDEPLQPITGFENRRFWPPDDGSGLFGEAAGTRGIVLLYSYVANESYDYLPPERAYMRAGTIMTGPESPGRITIAPYLQAAMSLGDLHATVTQPAIGGTAPGIRLRYRIGAPELLVFNEPWFRSTSLLGPDGPVVAHKRRTGIGLRWSWEK